MTPPSGESELVASLAALSSASTSAEASTAAAAAKAAAEDVSAEGVDAVAALKESPWWAHGQPLPELPEALLSLALRHEATLGLPVLRALLAKLLPKVKKAEEMEEEVYVAATEEVRGTYQLAQSALLQLLRLSPLCRARLRSGVKAAFPGVLSPSSLRYADFVGNVVQLATALGGQESGAEEEVAWDGETLSEELWLLVLAALLDADSELCRPATDETATKRQARVRHRLDHSLNFVFLLLSRLEGSAKRHLVDVLMSFLQRRLLDAPQASHVPFIYFLLGSQSGDDCRRLLKWLWRAGGVGADSAAELAGCRRRQAALCYLADLIARASFIDAATTKKWLGQLASWALSYLAERESAGGPGEGSLSHASFYAVCHAIFFILGFRHADLVSAPDDVGFLQELELDRLVHSRPQPLKYCPLPVALTFVAVARRYQLVWCREMAELGRGSGVGGGSEREALLPFQAVYPFEPYDLPLSAAFFPQRTSYRLQGGLAGTPWLGPSEPLDGAALSAEDGDSGLGEEGLPKGKRARNVSTRISFCDEADLDDYGDVPGFKNFLPLQDPMEI